jgi:hypothetical protein
MKRSKISARARTEQAIRGQMGQPAACMMDSNCLVSARGGQKAIMAQLCGHPCATGGTAIASVCMRASPTVSVDNFVEKAGVDGRTTAPHRGWNKMLVF